jgi:hypothetical protein
MMYGRRGSLSYGCVNYNGKYIRQDENCLGSDWDVNHWSEHLELSCIFSDLPQISDPVAMVESQRFELEPDNGIP